MSDYLNLFAEETNYRCMSFLLSTCPELVFRFYPMYKRWQLSSLDRGHTIQMVPALQERRGGIFFSNPHYHHDQNFVKNSWYYHTLFPDDLTIWGLQRTKHRAGFVFGLKLCRTLFGSKGTCSSFPKGSTSEVDAAQLTTLFKRQLGGDWRKKGHKFQNWPLGDNCA